MCGELHKSDANPSASSWSCGDSIGTSALKMLPDRVLWERGKALNGPFETDVLKATLDFTQDHTKKTFGLANSFLPTAFIHTDKINKPKHL